MSNHSRLPWNDDEIAPNASPEERAALQRTRTVAQLLDDAIPVPGIDYRIGLDPLIGLLPVSGDIITGLIGLYVVAEAALARAPPALLGRMLLNLALDVGIGTIPIAGDIFDAVWKANVRNVDLFEDYVTGER
jgi:hypothetical protein